MVFVAFETEFPLPVAMNNDPASYAAVATGGFEAGHIIA
jgi:hypothetical protein